MHYALVNIFLLVDYPFHGIDNINTQYFQTVGPTTTYILNAGGFRGFAVDTSPYPASGCTDSLTPGNCITDAQIKAEIQKVMLSKGWTGGLNNQFLLYTSSGEGSCFDPSSTSCAYTQYCAYHGSIGTSPPIIYSNIPFADHLNDCQNAGQPSPNGDPVADAATDVASHEISESITDPLVNVNSAWFTALGNENGDLCRFNFGTNTWTSMVTHDATRCGTAASTKCSRSGTITPPAARAAAPAFRLAPPDPRWRPPWESKISHGAHRSAGPCFRCFTSWVGMTGPTARDVRNQRR